ncbi:MAG: Eco57I restriction-modification methylase domain-containing protein [Canibacter sp.]
MLNTIANLSNDEVFTPPELANEMLDMLEKAWAEGNNGANIWADHTVTFLDPFTKSGVFLREITARLVKGLEEWMPDLQQRVNHILTNQVFGIGITQLTSLLARRSVYCSKSARGKHSIVKTFDRDWGNIWFERTEHTWIGGTEKVITMDENGNTVLKATNGRCKYCGASQKEYERSDALESHAYAFIHTDDIKARMAELFGENMHFDVIVGNPPYQLETEAERRQAKPIYQHFVEQAKKLEPRYVLMITPSRWMQGGMGLAEFRNTMLNDDRVSALHDFIVERDAFPSVNANGGVSYFLWDRDYSGNCKVTTVAPGGDVSPAVLRELNEFDIFVRWNQALPILRKVLSLGEPAFASRVSSIGPFGLPTNFHGRDKSSVNNPIKLHGSKRVSWVNLSDIPNNKAWINEWKVLFPRATDGNEKYPLPIWDSKGPFVAGPGEACTWTYLVASVVQSESEAKYLVEYMRTKFFRFLVSLRKVTQDNKAESFQFVPDLPLDRVWSDQDLYERYGLTEEEVCFVESQIRTMRYIDE